MEICESTLKVSVIVYDDNGNTYEGTALLEKSGKGKSLRNRAVVKMPKPRKADNSPKSIMGYLLLLKDEGFFDIPRSRKDILEKLASLKKYYEPNSLNSTLQRAFATKKLGRISRDDIFLYVSR